MAVEIWDGEVPAMCWPLDPACLTAEWDALSDAIQERSWMLAVQSLRRLTGFRVGGCPITVRPCKPACAIPGRTMTNYFYPGVGQPFYPANWSGAWYNGCGCSGDCGCSATCETKLPLPIGDVTEVKVDGVAMDLEDFRVDGDTLVYMGTDDCPFNMAQDLSLPDTEPGTWSVTYMNTYPVDANGAYAAGVLAMEFSKACTGSQKCRLPTTVTDMIRNGVSLTITSGTFPGGVTGIREVDQYIGLWRPEGSPTHASQVYSPDAKPPRMITRTFT